MKIHIQEPSKEKRTLCDVIREAREELSTYHDILEISDRVKKSEPKMDFGKKRDYPKSVAIFRKKNEDNSISGISFSPYKKSDTFGAKDDLKDVQCFKCHKKDLMRTNVPKLRSKIQRGRSKCEKWMRVSPRMIPRRSLFVKSKFDFVA